MSCSLSNRARDSRMARAYEALVRFASFGQFERFYRTVAAEIPPCAGGSLLDLGCGLGSLVPHLLAKVGETARATPRASRDPGQGARNL